MNTRPPIFARVSSNLELPGEGVPLVLLLLPASRPPIVVAIQPTTALHLMVPCQRLDWARDRIHKGPNTAAVATARDPAPYMASQLPNRVHHSRTDSLEYRPQKPMNSTTLSVLAASTRLGPRTKAYHPK